MPFSYQNLPFQIDPIAFSWGGFDFRWYSLSYLVAFLTVYWLLRFRQKKDSLDKKISRLDLDQLFLFLIAGLLLGARLGYLLFYDFSDFLRQPWLCCWPFENGNFQGISGLSFHGGLIGTALALKFYCRKKNLSFVQLTDFIVPAVALGYFWGRIGNFLNGELFGRTTDFFLAMRFPLAPDNFLRHPSQLYEAIGEGLLIFLLLWPQRNNPRLKGKFFALYLLLYGVVRFLIEFVRQPDSHLGSVLGEFTLGQLLCLGMIAIAVILINFTNRKLDS